MKVKYQKPKIISCRDCIYMKKCMEWSRLTPCRDFKPSEEQADEKHNTYKED
ncbi:MAG: hypothetical protein J6M07_01375 [Ruminococcus sp.]|nr:hypothetical protein [Ruminococcus sp.]